MLTLLRGAAGTWVAKIFLGVLILSFAVWGITGASFNFASGTLASVGSASISTAEFQRQFAVEISRVGQQFGQRLTSAQARQFGLDRQVLGRLINQAALDDRVNVFGLGISEDRLADEILKDPAFLDSNGEFNAFQYQQLIVGNGLTEKQFLDDQRKAYGRRQIVDAMTADFLVPDALLDAINLHSNETRDVSFIEIDARDIEEIKTPTDAVLSAYFDENKRRYRAPEYRSLKYFALQASGLGGADRITEEDALAYYNENKRRYESVEKRTIRRINFETEAKAREAENKLKGGMSFDDLIADLGLTAEDVNLGIFEERDVLDQKLGEAAFKLEANAPSDVVATDFGRAIIMIDEIEGGTTQIFEDVKSTIKDELAADQNNRELLDKSDEIEDARSAGSTFEEIAEKFKLNLVTVTDVARSGDLSGGGSLSADTPARDALLNGAFDTDVDVENDVIEIGRDGFAWYEVSDVKSARDRTLDELKEQVISDWLTAETQKAVIARAEALTKELQEGKTIEALASDLGRTASLASKVRRGQPAEGLSGPAVSLAFSGVEGFVTSATGDADNQAFVMKVTKVSAPENNTAALVEGQLREALQNDVIGTYIDRVRVREGSTINPEALELASDLERQQHGGGYGL